MQSWPEDVTTYSVTDCTVVIVMHTCSHEDHVSRQWHHQCTLIREPSEPVSSSVAARPSQLAWQTLCPDGSVVLALTGITR